METAIPLVKRKTQGTELHQYGNALKFVFVDESLNGLHQDYTCRDFIQAFWWANYTGGDGTVLGYTPELTQEHTKSEFQLCIFNDTRYSLAFSFKERIEEAMIVFNRLEKNLEFKRSTYQECRVDTAEPQDGVLITSSIAWTRQPYLIGFYSLLLRTIFTSSEKFGLTNEMNDDQIIECMLEKDYNSSDLMSLRGIKDVFTCLMKNEVISIHKWSDFKDISSAHGESNVLFTFQYDKNKKLIQDVINAKQTATAEEIKC